MNSTPSWFFEQYAIDKELEELVRKHSIDCEELSEKQLVEAFKQALLSGDFLRVCVPQGDKQSIIYLPYREHEQQEEEKANLKKQLALCVRQIQEVVDRSTGVLKELEKLQEERTKYFL